LHKQRNECQRKADRRSEILHHMESCWRAGGASRKRSGDRPSAQRLERAQQFGKNVITQAPALTSGSVLAEGAIAFDLDLAQVTAGKWRRSSAAYGLEVFAFTRPTMRVETALLFR
jgi:hypothetical protein